MSSVASEIRVEGVGLSGDSSGGKGRFLRWRGAVLSCCQTAHQTGMTVVFVLFLVLYSYVASTQ